MDQKIICLSAGLSQDEIEKGKALYFAASEGQSTLEVTAMSRSMLNMKIIEILACLMEELEKDPAEKQNDSGDVIPADHCKTGVLVMLAQDRELVLQVMRSFKAVLPDPRNVIFAVITETALKWTLAEYLEHLSREHEYMQTRRPENNPDMKKL